MAKERPGFKRRHQREVSVSVGAKYSSSPDLTEDQVDRGAGAALLSMEPRCAPFSAKAVLVPRRSEKL
jgi:hypothetical protein